MNKLQVRAKPNGLTVFRSTIEFDINDGRNEDRVNELKSFLLEMFDQRFHKGVLEACFEPGSGSEGPTS
jgi:hypothetical protein